MAPIKFEENIREKLQERELQPQKDSWEKLSSMLDEQIPERKSNGFFWVAVAASFVGVLLVAGFLFTSKEDPAQIVEETPTKIGKDIQESPVEEAVVFESPKDGTEPVENTQKLPASSKRIAQIGTSNSNSKTSNKDADRVQIKTTITQENIALQGTEKEEGIDETNDAETLFVNKKVEEVVVAVQKIQQENQTVTPDEIDALLAKAQRDIANNRILTAGTQKVDAAALLMDVETELEQSFRDRVFEALGEGFNKVRTAVAERNN